VLQGSKLARNTTTMANPVSKFLGEWLDEPLMKRLFMENPRVAIETKVGVPEDIILTTEERDNIIYFKSSIPKNPGDRVNDLGQRRIEDQRIKKCPIMGVSEQEIISDPVTLFKKYNIDIPSDMTVVVDEDEDGYIHFECVIDYSSRDK
jgi:hypothetical protein